jgi:hypothetical protein
MNAILGLLNGKNRSALVAEGRQNRCRALQERQPTDTRFVPMSRAVRAVRIAISYLCNVGLCLRIIAVVFRGGEVGGGSGRFLRARYQRTMIGRSSHFASSSCDRLAKPVAMSGNVASGLLCGLRKANKNACLQLAHYARRGFFHRRTSFCNSLL